MRILIRVIVVLAVLTFVIVAHEFGHFVAAKAFGYDVKEFSVGWFGPTFASFELWDTPFNFKVGLIGGYNSFDPEVWKSMTLGDRTVLLLAGSVPSLLLAFLAVWALKREEISEYVRLLKLEMGYPYYGWISYTLQLRASRDPEFPTVKFPPVLSSDFILFMFVSINACNLSYFIAFLDGGKIVNGFIGAIFGLKLDSWILMLLPFALMMTAMAATEIADRAYRKRRHVRRMQEWEARFAGKAEPTE